MRIVGYWLINILLILIFIITCAGTIAEKSVGFGIATLVVVGLFILNTIRFNKQKDNTINERFKDNADWKLIGEIKPNNRKLKTSYLYINEKDKKFFTNDNEYEFKNLISAEIVNDNISRTVSNHKENFTGTRVIGTSGTQTFCKKLQVKLVLNSISEPQTYITLLNRTAWNRGRRYKKADAMAQKFLSTFQVIIHNNK